MDCVDEPSARPIFGSLVQQVETQEHCWEGRKADAAYLIDDHQLRAEPAAGLIESHESRAEVDEHPNLAAHSLSLGVKSREVRNPSLRAMTDVALGASVVDTVSERAFVVGRVSEEVSVGERSVSDW